MFCTPRTWITFYTGFEGGNLQSLGTLPTLRIETDAGFRWVLEYVGRCQYSLRVLYRNYVLRFNFERYLPIYVTYIDFSEHNGLSNGSAGLQEIRNRPCDRISQIIHPALAHRKSQLFGPTFGKIQSQTGPLLPMTPRNSPDFIEASYRRFQ